MAYEGRFRSNINVKTNIFPLEMSRKLSDLICWIKTNIFWLGNGEEMVYLIC